MSNVKKSLGFRFSLWYLTSGKNFMVIRPAVPEILGGLVFHVIGGPFLLFFWAFPLKDILHTRDLH